MKRLFILALMLIAFQGTAMAQLALTCPPCTPVKGCDKCYATVAAAQADGCQSASRVVNPTTAPKPVESWVKATLYPNPSYNGEVTLANPDGLKGEISIMDPSGRLLQTYRLNGERDFQFPDRLTAGLYFIILTSSEGEVATKMLMIH